MALPLDPSISPGQSGHRTDHETIATTLNGLDAVADGEVLRWDEAGQTFVGDTPAQLAANAAFTDSFVPAFVVAAAYGDGVTNARAAIQAKLDAASAAGGGIVFLPEGTYLVDMAAVSGFAGYYAGLLIPSKVTLRGAGEGVTTVKLIASEVRDVAAGDGASIIYNQDLDGSGDVNLGVMDLTVDGNAANQTKVHNGIVMVRTRGARFTRVTVKNVRGTASSGASETFAFDTQLGMDTTYTDCTALRDAGSTASGFSANQATGVHYRDCIAYGMTNSMGFTHWDCEQVSYVGCHAYLNGVNGFNSEESRNVSYGTCHAGGEVAPGTTPWPLAAGTTLGNTGSGFVVNGTKNALLAACTSRKNAGGVTLAEGTAGASGRIVGCAFTDNTANGINASTAATLLRWSIEATEVSGNNGGSTEYDLPTGWTDGPGAQLTTPTIPASDAALTNPYPFPVTVFFATAGDVSRLRVNGVDIIASANSVRLLPAMTITLTYSTAPTWVWFGG